MALYTIRPLVGWVGPTTPHRQRKRAPFRSSTTATHTLLARELRMLDARAVVVQVRCDEGQIRNDGQLYASARLGDPSVRLLFDSRHGPLAYSCDRFDRWEDNLRAVALALEALRKVDRYEVTTDAGPGAQYKGYRQITDGSTVPVPVHDDVVTLALGVLARWGMEVDEPMTVRVDRLRDDPAAQRAAHGRARRRVHPDVSGDHETWHEVERAAATLGLL